MQGRLSDPRIDRHSSKLPDLELHRPLRPLLKDYRALRNTIPVGNIANAEFNQVEGHSTARNERPRLSQSDPKPSVASVRFQDC